MQQKKRVLISYAYFLPAYKAGGPVQSIANLCRNLKSEYDFFIICRNVDHNSNEPLPVEKDKWIDFESGTARVNYISDKKLSRKTILRLIDDVNPDYIFINGIFSPLFSIVPLLHGSGKKIWSVRGMLHPGALSQKRLKKRIFLFVLRLLNVQKNVFHATDEKERNFVKLVLGKEVNVLVAQNFPNNFSELIKQPKLPGLLRLVSIALISPMKNHLLVLKALMEVKGNVIYDIFGPVKDEVYWQECQKLIRQLPPNIKVEYKGSVDPSKVSEILALYDSFILPSKSENFGHAIFEALSGGLPVITSHNTAWNELEANNSGWNVDIDNSDELTAVIERIISYDEFTWSTLRAGSKDLASKAIDREKIKIQYSYLFA
jgi:glycosyltransferase involved in cell wall biosynthesis